MNPLRVGLVENLQELSLYRWSGHSALLGTVAREWQDRERILAYFGSDVEKAREGYERFVSDGIALGSRSELVGGGLVRSYGNWSQVVSLRKKGEAISSDALILGSSDFVDRLLSEVGKKEKDTLRFFSGK